IVAHLPKSPLRSTLVQICGWATAAMCGTYIVSPLDVVPDVFFPFGFIDDILAAVAGYKAAKAAWDAGKEKAAMKTAEADNAPENTVSK
ncbi:MAG TPA: DUF1232 domain-containing protein, partial [Pirellulales bacterium]